MQRDELPSPDWIMGYGAELGLPSHLRVQLEVAFDAAELPHIEGYEHGSQMALVAGRTWTRGRRARRKSKRTKSENPPA